MPPGPLPDNLVVGTLAAFAPAWPRDDTIIEYGKEGPRGVSDEHSNASSPRSIGRKMLATASESGRVPWAPQEGAMPGRHHPRSRGLVGQ
jgi:hypothetical protein